MEESLWNTGIVTRYKRHTLNDEQANNLPLVAKRQHKIKKITRKIENNPNNTLSNTSETNDNIDIKLNSSNNSDNHENTQGVNTFATNHSPQQRIAAQQFKLNKRRIIIPIRKTRVNPTNAPKETISVTSQSSNEEVIQKSKSIALNETTTTSSNEQKKKLFVKRRRITQTPFVALEPFLTENRTLLPSSSTRQMLLKAEVRDVDTSLELKTRLETIKRIYTYLVTRVHDNQSEIISSKLLSSQIKTFTDTITHTVLKTALNIQPTEMQKFAHNFNTQTINE